MAPVGRDAELAVLDRAPRDPGLAVVAARPVWARLLAHVLDGAVEAATAHSLWDMSRGEHDVRARIGPQRPRLGSDRGARRTLVLAAAEALVAEPNHAKVSGLGESAFVSSVIPPNAEVQVLLKKLLFNIEYSSDDPLGSTRQDDVVALAKLAVGRL